MEERRKLRTAALEIRSILETHITPVQVCGEEAHERKAFFIFYRCLAERFGLSTRDAPHFFPAPALTRDEEGAGERVRRALWALSDKLFASPEDLGAWYQAFVSRRREAAFVLLQKGVRVSKEDLAPATQIFTPRWVAEYLVQNAIGHSTSLVGKGWKFYIPSDSHPSAVSLEEFTLLDPCMGCGALLLPAFDALMELYGQQGIPPAKAARRILSRNLFGMEIDPHAAELARAALLLRAAAFDPSVLPEPPPMGLHCIQEDGGAFQNARQFGSLLKPGPLAADCALKEQGAFLSRRFHAVAANPPYMGKKSLNEALRAYLERHYPEGRSELYAAFIRACVDKTLPGGVCAMVTIHSWMFLKSFRALRSFVLENTRILSAVHSGAGTFEALADYNALAAAFCLRKGGGLGEAVFVRLGDYVKPAEKRTQFPRRENRFFVSQEEFFKTPERAFLYHASPRALAHFSSLPALSARAELRQGLATGDNKRFVRYWYEVEKDDICFDARSTAEFHASGKKYAPYNKGGIFRKWYGGATQVIAFDPESRRALEGMGNRLPSRGFYFREGLTWSLFGFENFSVRCKPAGFVFDVSGASLFAPEDELLYLLAFLSSTTAFYYLSMLAPTVNFQVGNIASLPVLFDASACARLEPLARECVRLAREDWDAQELSWDFTAHPLAAWGRLSDAFRLWEREAADRYDKLRASEEEINRIFIRLYGLSGEVSHSVRPRDLSVRTADAARDARELISYAVGCVLGRYEKGGPLAEGLLAQAVAGFLEERLGHMDENLAFLAKAIGGRGGTPMEVLTRYLEKDFYREHCKRYKKRPVYTVRDGLWRYVHGQR